MEFIKNNKLTQVLYFIAGVCFFISAIIGKNYAFIPIGCCFIVLGIINNINDKGKKDKPEE